MHTPLSHLGAWFVALALLLTACAPASSLSKGSGSSVPEEPPAAGGGRDRKSVV